MDTQLIDRLAQEIRRVDGSNSLGAAALAEALMPFVTALQSSGGEGVEWALRDEADGTYWQFFTDKDAGAKRAAIHGDTLVPLYLASPAQPRGFRLVPVEPTMKMERAWLDEYGGDFVHRYAAMLSAAPAPIEQEG